MWVASHADYFHGWFFNLDKIVRDNYILGLHSFQSIAFMCTICIFAYVILSVRAIDGMEHIIRPAKDIRELVDSLCKDGADAQYIQCLSKSRILSPQMLKPNLSTQPSSLSTFMISQKLIELPKSYAEDS